MTHVANICQLGRLEVSNCRLAAKLWPTNAQNFRKIFFTISITQYVGKDISSTHHMWLLIFDYWVTDVPIAPHQRPRWGAIGTSVTTSILLIFCNIIRATWTFSYPVTTSGQQSIITCGDMTFGDQFLEI